MSDTRRRLSGRRGKNRPVKEQQKGQDRGHSKGTLSVGPDKESHLIEERRQEVVRFESHEERQCRGKWDKTTVSRC